MKGVLGYCSFLGSTQLRSVDLLLLCGSGRLRTLIRNTPMDHVNFSPSNWTTQQPYPHNMGTE